jgi:glycerol uptake facilitator-like aquaporin
MYKYLAEFLATTFFVYIILATGNPIAIGAALTLALLLTQDGMLNPAVTIAMVSTGKIELEQLIPYCIVQILGALVAVELFKRVKI